MSGETEEQTSGWTVDTLNYYFQKQIDDLRTLLDERAVASDKAVQAALLSAEKAVTKAENSAEKRFEATNEFRGQLADQQRTLLSRNEYDSAHGNLVDRVNELQDRMNRAEGRGQGYAALYGWGVAAITTIIAVVVLANALLGK